MIDLKNTYIVNDKGELRDLYISALGRLGVDTSESDEHFLIYEPDDYPHMDTARLGWHNYNNSRRLTLADFKPKTRTEYKYEKVTESIFDLKEEFERGELYWFYNDECRYVPCRVEKDLLIALDVTGGIYRKVKMDWRDVVDDFLSSCKHLTPACDISLCVTKPKSDDPQDLAEWEELQVEFLRMCHEVSEMTEKPE